MMTIILVLLNVLLLSPHDSYGDVFTSIEKNDWKHLVIQDIVQITAKSVGSAMVDAAVKVVPYKNIADDPLNQHVDGLSLYTKIKSSLVNDAKLGKKEFLLTPHLTEALEKTIEHLKIFIDEALDRRKQVLDASREERIQTNLELILEDIRPLNVEMRDSTYSAEAVIQQVKTYIPSIIIQNILSYPIVKDELMRAVNAKASNEEDAIVRIRKTLIPFFLEGIRKEDAEPMEKYNSDIAENELESDLRSEIKKIFLIAVTRANMLDKILSGDVHGEVTISKDMEEEYTTAIRKAISMFFSRGAPNRYNMMIENVNLTKAHEFRSIFNDRLTVSKQIKNSLILMNFPLYRRKIKDLLAKRLEDDLKLPNFYDMPTMNEFANDILVKCEEKIMSEFESYITAHRNINQTKLPMLFRFAKSLLSDEYKDIKSADIDLMKQRDIYLEGKLPSPNDRSVKTLERLKTFQYDIEKEAMRSLGLLNGMFLYSEPYYQLFDALEESEVYLSKRQEL